MSTTVCTHGKVVEDCGRGAVQRMARELGTASAAGPGPAYEAARVRCADLVVL
jgi:hypothetical protein